MKNRLAEQLLATVLGWSPAEVAGERPLVQALAAYKYDEYRQFSTGSHFVESLALWLRQFATPRERRIAYHFVKRQLIFCSSAELRQLVGIAYPDYVRPLLIERAAPGTVRKHRPLSVVRETGFRVLQRQCIFLGLSDGAQIDTFRRANTDLNHEQIWHTTELSKDREDKLADRLAAHLHQILGRAPRSDECRFTTLVLLDDLTASGTSCYGLPAKSPSGGKIANLSRAIADGRVFSKLVDVTDLNVIVLFYIGTDQAVSHLKEAGEATWGQNGIPCAVKVVQRLPGSVRILRGEKKAINELIEHSDYYDHDIYDEHFRKGGTGDGRYGYGDCGASCCATPQQPEQFVSSDHVVRRQEVPRTLFHACSATGRWHEGIT